MASSWRPNSFTMACPVCISSMCPLRFPVRSHWAANCTWLRLAMTIATIIEAGTTSTETNARSGLIVSIMISTPMTVSSDVMSWVRLCWSVWLMLSMSLVTRDRMSPRDSRSK